MRRLLCLPLAGCPPAVKELAYGHTQSHCPVCPEASSRGQSSGLWASVGEMAVRLGGTDGCDNPTPSPSFREAGAEMVAMVTTAPWSGDFSLSFLCSSPSSSHSGSSQVFSLSLLKRGRDNKQRVGPAGHLYLGAVHAMWAAGLGGTPTS